MSTGIASYLRGLRQGAGLTQREAAGHAHLSTAAVNRIEQGKACPRPSTLGRLLAAYGIPRGDERARRAYTLAASNAAAFGGPITTEEYEDLQRAYDTLGRLLRRLRPSE